MTHPAIPDHVDLIVTHGGCHDGFTAQWLLHARWPDAECHPGAYGENIDRLAEMGGQRRRKFSNGETHVIAPGDERPSVLVMADFSYELREMLHLAVEWDRIILLDHHASAIAKLDGHLPRNVECVFDVDRSGAGIVADWLGCRVKGGIVDYVEDRDLWRFALPGSREAIQYLIAATSHIYGEWDRLNWRMLNDRSACLRDGNLVGRYHNLIVDELVGKARPAFIDGHETLIVPSPYRCGSDVAGRLAEMSPSGIGAYYQDLPDRIEYGLRSTPNGPDVAKIAERFGGGGHPHASGFRRDRYVGHSEVLDPA